jgi:hypothetical protein
MGYVTNRRGLYRTGWRPQSNPYAATQLGLTPFEPEVLREHGLGHDQAFTPSGGYGLHGLGDIVPNGSLVTYTGQWIIPNSAFTMSPSQLLAAVANAVNRDGLHVVNSSQDSGFLGVAMLEGAFNVTLQIQVSNGMGFGQPSDIASIVDHEVYASGATAQGSSVSVTSIPGSAPGVNLPPTDITTWLEQNAMWIGLAVLGVFVVPKVLERF